jgi:glycerol-3-phosphate acyltransferase PlsX
MALNRAYDAARNRLLDRVHDRILETLAGMPAPSVQPQTEPPALAASR